MNRKTTKLWRANPLVLSAALTALWLAPAGAQLPVDDHDQRSTAEGYAQYEDVAVDVVILTPDELDELVGPLALYPDDLLAIALPASTYPLDIVEAARFLDKHERDRSLQPSEDWDESVTALLNYPEVVRLMNDDIDWTWRLGGAVLNQQPDVIEAVERFRDRAYAAGNLRSDEYQTVSNDGESIEILPADEEVIYVPYYEPREVVIRHVRPVYYYYPRPRPVYYYPYPAGHFFFDYGFWGVSTAYRIGWSSNHLNVWHYTFRGHPYFGHRYSARHYRRPTINIYNTRYVNSSGRYAADRHRYGDRWRPRRHGVRPVGDRPRSHVHRDRGRSDAFAHDAGARANQRAVRRQDRDYSYRDQNRRRQDRDYTDRDQNRRRPVVNDRDVARETRPAQRRDEIRFRERPRTATASVRHSTQSDGTEDVRRRNRYTAPTRSARDTAAARNPQTGPARRQVQRSAEREDRRPVTRATRERSTMTHNAPALRKPATRAKPPAATRERRPDNQAGNAARNERKAQTQARERKEARGDNKPARSASRQQRRQRR